MLVNSLANGRCRTIDWLKYPQNIFPMTTLPMASKRPARLVQTPWYEHDMEPVSPTEEELAYIAQDIAEQRAKHHDSPESVNRSTTETCNTTESMVNNEHVYKRRRINVGTSGIGTRISMSSEFTLFRRRMMSTAAKPRRANSMDAPASAPSGTDPKPSQAKVMSVSPKSPARKTRFPSPKASPPSPKAPNVSKRPKPKSPQVSTSPKKPKRASPKRTVSPPSPKTQIKNSSDDEIPILLKAKEWSASMKKAGLSTSRSDKKAKPGPKAGGSRQISPKESGNGPPRAPLFSYETYKSPTNSPFQYKMPTIVYAQCVSRANKAIKKLQGPVIAFDMEWPVLAFMSPKKRKKRTEETALVQLYDGHMVVLIQLSHIYPRVLPVKLVQLLQSPVHYKVGVGIHGA